jgi:sodium-dependent dicarboxylate transporter 2/3/5
MPKVLLIDDEDLFRESLAKRLNLRGYKTIDLGKGEDAVKVAKCDPDIDVVILDRKMPGISGEQVLREIKEFRPEVPVIFLTGHSSIDSAMEVGRLEAYAYLEKPCDFDQLIEVVDRARADKVRLAERHEIPTVEKGSIWKWLIGVHNSRPGIIILGLVIILGLTYVLPTPQRLTTLLSYQKTGDNSEDINVGYAAWSKMKEGETIAQYYARTAKLGREIHTAEGRILEPIGLLQVEQRAKLMLSLLLVAAIFWASGAVCRWE